MKLERTRNATRNIAFDGTLEIVNLLFPFVIRSVMLHCLGTEYLGLNGLFRSLLTFLNLAELGVGSAMVFSMYRPIAEDDAPTICALLRLYRTLYRIIGLVVGAVGLLLVPVLPDLISGDVPAGMNLYVLYLMNHVLPFLPIKIGLCVESMVIRMISSSSLELTVLSIPRLSIAFKT